MAEINACQICGSGQSMPWHKVNDWTLVRCAKCGFIYLNPRPSIDHFKGIYDPLTQYNYKVEGVEYIKKEKDFISAYHTQLEGIEKHVPKGALLEIGSACGFFLEAARQRGWKPCGVELSKGGADYSRERFGLEVYNCDISEAGLKPGSFDCIVTIHTLEHVFDPGAVIRVCAGLLRPEGVIVVEIPFVKDAAKPAENVNAADLPSHVSYFTTEVLKQLLELNGFTILETGKGENLRITARKAGPSAKKGVFEKLSRLITN